MPHNTRPGNPQRNPDVPAEQTPPADGAVIPASKPKRNSNAGGRAGRGGFDFQDRVATYFATLVLSGDAAPRFWELPAGTAFTAIYPEASQPTDDLILTTSTDGFVFINVKRTLGISEDPKSEFASVIDQFVRQVLHNDQPGLRNQLWETRALDWHRGDRLVLVVGPGAASSVREDLQRTLDRQRELPPVNQPGDPVNDGEARILQILRRLIESSATTHGHAPADKALIGRVLGLMHVTVLGVEDGGESKHHAETILGQLLEDSSQASQAWQQVYEKCKRGAMHTAGATQATLRSHLHDAGYALRSNRKTRNVPYSTAPELNRYVPREREYAQIKQALLNDHETNAVGIQGTAALRGTGGFGKTTLAKAICADPEVKAAFPDGRYWLQLNEHATRDAALGKLNDFLRWLDPNQDPVGTIETARAAVKQALSQLRVLLVIDDAWTRGALEPFDGLGCSTLVTTRHLNVLPTGCQTVTVDAMQPVEAVETLLLDLEQAPAEVQRLRQPLNTLAKRVGHWPVLLGLINAWIRNELATGSNLEASINTIEELLEQGGITVLDDQADPESRSKAVTFTVQTSLERLPNLPGTMGLARDRFVQLAIFPEDVTIRFEVLASLWGLHPVLVKQVCGVFWDASLLLERTPQSVRLHDVIRKYLIDAHHADLPGWHIQLLAACRPKSKRWADLPKENTYLWRWLPDHLEGAGLADELRATAFDFEFLHTKLEVLHGDVNAVIDGVGRVPDRDANVLARTLRLGAHVLGRNPEQLAFQLVGRLIGHPLLEATDDLRELIRLAKVRLKAQGLEPVVHKPFLTPPGVLEQVLKGHSDYVNSAVAMLDNGRVISGSHDDTVRIWNLETGESTVLKGHTGSVFAVAVLDDHRIVSGSDDNTVRVWNLEIGEITVLKGHTGSVFAVAVLDDHRIVSGSWDNTVCIWNLETGESTVLKGHTGSVRAVVVVDDHCIISGSSDNTVRVWNLKSDIENLQYTFDTPVIEMYLYLMGTELIVETQDDKIFLFQIHF